MVPPSKFCSLLKYAYLGILKFFNILNFAIFSKYSSYGFQTYSVWYEIIIFKWELLFFVVSFWAFFLNQIYLIDNNISIDILCFKKCSFQIYFKPIAIVVICHYSQYINFNNFGSIHIFF